MIYLFDKSEKLINTVLPRAVKDPVYTEVLQAPGTLSVVIPREAIEGAVYIGHIDPHNRNELHQYRITKTAWSNDGVEVQGVESAYDDLRVDGFIKDVRPQGESLISLMQRVLSGTEWELGSVMTNPEITGSFYFMSRLEVIQKLAETYQFEWKPRIEFNGTRITRRVLDISPEFGKVSPRRFVYGHDLVEVQRKDGLGDIFTGLVGRGKGEEIGDSFGRKIGFGDVEWKIQAGDPVDKPLGQDWVEIPEYTALWGLSSGRPRIGIVEFPDETDPERLLQLTYDNLVNVGRPQITYSAKVADISEVGVGDRVQVIRHDWDLYYETRVFEKSINLFRTGSASVKLGDRIGSYNAKQRARTEAKIEEVRQSNQTVAEQVREIINSMTEFYWGEDGYNYDLEVGNPYGLPAGLYSFDKPIDQDPTKFIYVGAGKIIISDKKDPQGEWILKTILDGKGLGTEIVGADQILAGTISSDHISAGGIDADKITVGEAEAKKSLEQALSELSEADLELFQQAINEAQGIYNNSGYAEAMEEFNNAKAAYDDALISGEQSKEETKRLLKELESKQAILDEQKNLLDQRMDEIEKVQQSVVRTFYTDEKGRPTIKSDASTVQMVLDFNKLSIESDGKELAYFGQDKMFITSAEMKEWNTGRYQATVTPKQGVRFEWV